MTSPSGLDLRSPQPRIKQVRRSIIVVVAGVLIGILGMMVYGFKAHKVAAQERDQQRFGRIGPASLAAQKILDQQSDKAPAVAPQIVPLGALPQQQRPPVAMGAQPRVQYAQAPMPPMPEQPAATATESPRMRAERAAFEAEQKALSSPLVPAGWNAGSTVRGQDVAQSRQHDPGGQEDKRDFLRVAREPRQTSLLASRVPAPGRYFIAQGWKIPAILETEINSDLPGECTAMTRENVYDTATGAHLLIPQNSRLFGAYNSQVAYAQRGAQVVWYRIIFPDASSLDLQGMAAHDGQGRSGLRDKVDNHYARLISTAILTSAFFAAGALAQDRRGSLLGYPSAQEVAGTSAATNMSNEMVEITRRNLNIPPTQQIRRGDRFWVMVDKDILFDTPYRPLAPSK